MFQQLQFFTPQKPDWKDITTEWLFGFLNSLYPEMKFFVDSNITVDNTTYIRQGLHKKIECDFYIGQFDSDVTWVKNPIYIGVHYGKKFGSWGGTCYSIDSMEEFEENLPFIIEQCKNNISLYKKHITQQKNNNKQTTKDEVEI